MASSLFTLIRISIVLLGLQTLSYALPSPVAQEPTFTAIAPPPYSTIPPYAVMTYRSGSDITLTPWKARNFSVYLGGESEIHCPYPPNQCPSGNETVFRSDGSMDAIVPGGQLVYVASDGRLGYTQPHSATYPAGAMLLPFIRGMQSMLEPAYFLTTGAFGANGFMGCPLPDLVGIYQVFAYITNATVPTGNLSDCTSFNALAFDYHGPPVWEYL